STWTSSSSAHKAIFDDVRTVVRITTPSHLSPPPPVLDEMRSPPMQHSLSRRALLQSFAGGLACAGMGGWLRQVAAQAAVDPRRKRSCILLWMSGGPSQMDTFDLKPGHRNGGPFRDIPTTVPGIRIGEHLPLLARQAHRLALVRSMQTREGDHGR